MGWGRGKEGERWVAVVLVGRGAGRVHVQAGKGRWAGSWHCEDASWGHGGACGMRRAVNKMHPFMHLCPGCGFLLWCWVVHADLVIVINSTTQVCGWAGKAQKVACTLGLSGYVYIW